MRVPPDYHLYPSINHLDVPEIISAMNLTMPAIPPTDLVIKQNNYNHTQLAEQIAAWL